MLALAVLAVGAYIAYLMDERGTVKPSYYYVVGIGIGVLAAGTIL